MFAVAVFYAKVEPLNMSFGVGVDPEKEVKLALLQFDDAIEVASFKDAVKEPFSVLEVGVHALKGAIEETGSIVAIAFEFLL